MLDTRFSDDLMLRCEALIDRVAATAIGVNDHALRVALAECDAMERGVTSPFAMCQLRDVRHWLRLAYGHTLHAYPPDKLRTNLIGAIARFGTTVRTGRPRTVPSA